MSLRPYQERAFRASVTWMKKSASPFLVEAVTAAGKSHIIAAVAHEIHAMSGKRVLCLAPSAELVMQNHAKFIAAGAPASIYSASARQKSLRHPVVFATPLTVKNRLSRFCQPEGAGYAMVVIDECHGITPTIKEIVDAMRGGNPNLRVMGLTATPYRLGSGYIYHQGPDGKAHGMDKARKPYFSACVDRITAHELLEQGYITPPRIGTINSGEYDTDGLIVNSRGQFDAHAIDRAYHGHGRLTAAIVADVIEQSRDRQGVMFFAATVQHAGEIMASLPPELSAVVTGETKARDRQDILKRFIQRKIKYLVNVAVLTTGFDAPHVDVIAMLRRTESVGLLQQIIGRGLRLSEGKTDCLVLDYAGNIETHCPDGDVFAPTVRVGREGGGDVLDVKCPECGYDNQFAPRPDASQYDLDANGYCLDLDGNHVITEYGPMPGHFGRRCQGVVYADKGEFNQCGYRWTSKACPHCGEPNDIAARYCSACKGEIVDPNEKLIGDFKLLKKDPTKRQTDAILSMELRKGVSQAGNENVRVDFITKYRSFSIWYVPESNAYKLQRNWKRFVEACKAADETVLETFQRPQTVSYQKDPKTGFYSVIDFDLEADALPEGASNAA